MNTWVLISLFEVCSKLKRFLSVINNVKIRPMTDFISCSSLTIITPNLWGLQTAVCIFRNITVCSVSSLWRHHRVLWCSCSPSLSDSPSHCGTSLHRDPSSSRPGVQPHLPSPASSPGSPAAIRVEAGLPPPHRGTVQRPAWRHQLPCQSSEPRGLRRVHLWHHQWGWGRALHLPGHRWASWWC